MLREISCGNFLGQQLKILIMPRKCSGMEILKRINCEHAFLKLNRPPEQTTSGKLKQLCLWTNKRHGKNLVSTWTILTKMKIKQIDFCLLPLSGTFTIRTVKYLILLDVGCHSLDSKISWHNKSRPRRRLSRPPCHRNPCLGRVWVKIIAQKTVGFSYS